MTTEFKKTVFVTVLILCIALPVYADWQPSDGHKMHFPQLPDPCGWDIDLRDYWLADDWQCSKTGEVNDIHFWISCAKDGGGTISNIQVKIYSNDPNPPYSKPATQLWNRTIYDFNVRLIDPNGDQGYWIPSPTSPLLYPHDHHRYSQVNIKDINDPFVQVEGQIYWLSLRVALSDPEKRVGWKTSLNHFMDAAVVRYGTSWSPLYEPNSTMPIDFSFVITGGPNEPPYPTNAKWLQRPDLTTNGLDVKAMDPCILADDFECNKTTKITDITIWGSWKYDILPPAGPNDVNFTLSIHSDIPASQSPSGYSMPNEVLWYRNFMPGTFEVSIQRQDINEGWWEAWNPYVPIGDHVCWKYVFHIPEANAFCQKGEPNKPIVYWLDVQAHPYFGAQFGWKTSINHWNDDAVHGFGFEPYPSPWWYELRYPPGHPLEPNSIDLAFAIEGNMPCTSEPEVKWLQKPDLSTNGLDVNALKPSILADDFECNKSTRITDITVWGSWLADILPPGGPNNVRFTLSIHSDIPADPCIAGSYSMPGTTLWLKDLMPSEVSIEAQDINEGWWDPYYDWYYFPGDHICWKYVFHIAEANAFCQQGEPNRPVVYWLDVQADPNDPDHQAKFGWKTSINHWNDDAVWAPMGSEPYTGPWNELRYPSGHPYHPNSIDLAFAIDGNIAPENDLGDAPDSSNSSGAIMTAYPSGVVANYPTVYLDPTGLPPFGPIHQQPKGVAWLGGAVSLENEADTGPDQDPQNNIIPLTDTPNMDGSDDGVTLPIRMPRCRLVRFNYTVTVVDLTKPIFANVWCDFNRDGDWDDVPMCGSKPAPEWAVQNQPLAFALPGIYIVQTPSFRTFDNLNQTGIADIWMRITLSETPWALASGSGGSGPPNGYVYGETEDYFFVPDLSCWNCADFDLSGIVDTKDLQVLAEDWLWFGLPGGYAEADLDCDGDVQFTDFAILAKQWRGPCP